jgi:glycosyltransferase involved in cell wall biosynthesis
MECLLESTMNDVTNSPKDGSPMVTVALAVLNGGELLEHAVGSVINQSWPHWELLLLDDGSTDEAIDHLSLLADPRVVVIRDGQNLGLAYRLNQAVGMAKGKYIARMDHDDICHPERFARQIAYLEGHPEVDLLATQCVAMDEQERLVGRLPSAIKHEDICRRPWRGFYLAHPSWMGRTEWFRRNVYKDPAPYCCEDQELLLRAHYSSCYHTLPKCLLAYRIRTHTPWKKQVRTRVAMAKIKVRHFLEREELVNALLSALIGLAQISYDAWREFLYRLALPTKVRLRSMPTPKECEEWDGLITAIKDSSKRSKCSQVINDKV